MSQETSGQTNLEEQLDNILNEYALTKNAGNEFSGDVSEYLGMSRDELEALSKEERYTASLRLAQFGIYLQRLINREKARISWANSSIFSIAARHWDNYGEMVKADIKMYKIAHENPTMDKVIKIKNHAQIRIDELDGVAQLIKHFSDMMMRSTYVT